jgi:arylsulfatase
MIVHWSKGIKRTNAFENSVGHIIDLMPTFVELSGAAYPTEHNGKPIIPMEGRSLVKAFDGKQNESRTLYWEHEGNRGVREGDIKLVWIGERGEWELYDLKVDPIEMNDLAGQQPETVKRMADAWEAWAHRAFVVDALPDTTPGLKFDLDLSLQELKDLSGKNNPLAVRGDFPIEQKGRRFNRQSYIDVPHSDSLHCAETAWTVEATIMPDADEAAKHGIILARGGSGNGYSLSLREGKPVFCITVGGQRHVLQGSETVSGRVTLTGKIDDRRRASLEVDGKEVARLALPEWMKLPNEGMQIGIDRDTQVNDLRLPGFSGVIERVRIYRGAPVIPGAASGSL